MLAEFLIVQGSLYFGYVFGDGGMVVSDTGFSMLVYSDVDYELCVVVMV